MTCCEDKTNRELVEKADGKIVERCIVCGRKHIRLSFQAFRMGKPPTPTEHANKE